MAYRLKRGESVSDGIKRIVIEEIDSATERLRCGPKDRDEAIHEARKSVKKIRGAMRLVRGELGNMYRDEDSRFRDLGRQLSELRDAQAVIEVFDAIAQQYAGSIQKSALAAIRRGIESAKREKEQSIRFGELVRTAVGALRGARKRVAGWPLECDGFEAIAPGLKRTYRRGRAALARAQDTSDPLVYHDFRKRVKDHWYHVRLLESLWTESQQARESSLHDLETWLGDDHNLVVLSEQAQKDPDRYSGQEQIRLFLTLAAQHQKELRNNSIALGQRLYEERPRQFVRRMAKLWDVWQGDPKSMKRIQKDQRTPPKKQPGRADAAKGSAMRKTPAA
jgi:CHAD domain-containing protein